ncbi:single-stranded DNA-binding protein [Candidatus Jorgensenbacteria bacterium CG10_big_fil_rev_8_21_14_0_10_54_38]|uniref:Single-stranded DNA-binding protein n=1 Tax=Candidatus Jorgensenbacteria bacterium CG10_big_fil_rev_8_21_14_0_10_54_38 TaxID=1974593 RepID=A0A2M6WFV0_9BACT|nr:MAG: single-stranded DNA-binding protein [Candidatus Jorgensenbacteria bacterium CG10_big_fil_rev_8_21_14_0_10_54_38]
MNLNKVFLIGRLTADPQLRNTTTGQSVASFSIATNRTWTNKQGERQEDVQFHNVVVWGRQAEIANQFLRKGSTAMIEGRLQNRTWQDKQGQNRTTTEVVCERIQLGPRAAGAGLPAQAGGVGEFGGPSAGASTELSRMSSGFGGGKRGSPAEGTDEVKEEPLPEINVDEGDIKPESIPF